LGDALLWTERLVALSLLVQSLELWSLRRLAADDGVWRWAILRDEVAVFPRPIRAVLERLLAYPVFRVVLALRLVAAPLLAVVPHVAIVAFLFATSILVALRWRGSFNGGSDFMTLIVLSALTVAKAYPPVAWACLWYIALQACNSYFLAGVAKLRTANWRSGRALAGFAQTTVFGSPGLAGPFVTYPWLARAASWCVIGLECLFPLSLLHPTLALAFMGMAMAFHLGNAQVFGLNRFVLAWAATYPAVLYCAS
jgi:Vitamin K-dependent gamma-carboxylase